MRERECWSAEVPTALLVDGVALVAARFGDVRLIDSHILSEAPPLELAPSEGCTR